MATIETRHEAKRGCGYRKPGGLYLVSSGLLRPCGRLPIKLEICPTCNNGIKPARGWTWINFASLAADRPCLSEKMYCIGCLLAPADSKIPDGWELTRAGLIWVGEKFYKTPREFASEAAHMGVSRRVTNLPRDFKVGETVILFAHRKAIENEDGSFTAAIFQAFRPAAVEYVVKEDDDAEKLERLEERGFTLVRVIPVDANGDPIDKETAERLTDHPIDESLPLLDTASNEGDEDDENAEE
jgi:hypothetical protein